MTARQADHGDVVTVQQRLPELRLLDALRRHLAIRELLRQNGRSAGVSLLLDVLQDHVWHQHHV